MKYSLPEIERRWLVEIDLETAKSLYRVPFTQIEDIYFPETRLRLRKMTAPDGAVQYKLCKKYGKQTKLTEPITNLYLTEEEYALLAALPGKRVIKRRYKIEGGSLDVFELPPDAPAIFEKEFPSEADAVAYMPPVFVVEEITSDSEQTCANLAVLRA
ncbi:MAG: hypothetical protein QM758_28720 [Armatimonas sp.]